MSNNGITLSERWLEIERGFAIAQEKIEAAVLTGECRDRRFTPHLLHLLEDKEDEVRYYALQSLVLDLQVTDDLMQERCWELLREDPDADVRRMAAACLGKIILVRKSLHAFMRLVDELRSSSQPRAAKGAIYAALFQAAGRPPLEWPGLV